MLFHHLAFRNGDGGVIKWNGSSVEIQHRKKAEEQLHWSTQELRRREILLAETQQLSHTGSFAWKPEDGEIVWSDETYRIFEYDPATKITLDMSGERIHPDDRDLMNEAVEKAFRSGGAVDFQHRLVFPDGRTKHVRVLARRSGLQNRTYEPAGAVIDITEAKHAEKALQRIETELRRNDKEFREVIDAIRR